MNESAGAGAPLHIEYFTDVLCIWAWIAQRKTEELTNIWGQQVSINYRCLNVFGDAHSRIREQWADRNGFDGFGHHVLESASTCENAPVNADIWSKVRPTTSANAHLVIKAAQLVASRGSATQLAADIRHGFFVDAADISQLPVLYEIARSADLPEQDIKARVQDGTAAARLMADYQCAVAQNISGSPSWVLNEGRQKLYGNVSFRVLNANVEGLLKKHVDRASWC